MFTLEILIPTVLMAVLGALANILIWAKSWEDIKSFNTFRVVLLGVIIGVLYYFLRAEHGFPDSVVSFAFGYSGQDILEALVERFKLKYS